MFSFFFFFLLIQTELFLVRVLANKQLRSVPNEVLLASLKQRNDRADCSELISSSPLHKTSGKPRVWGWS